MQPAQPRLFISTHHVWLPEHHSCPKYPTCLQMVEITSSAQAHSIIPEAENNNPLRPLPRKSLRLWPSPVYSLATFGVYQQRRPGSVGAVTITSRMRGDSWRGRGRPEIYQESSPMCSCSQPAVLFNEVKETRRWKTLSEQSSFLSCCVIKKL